MADILLTGFLPFDGDTRNPSQLIVEWLQTQSLGIAGCVLPVDAVEAPKLLRAALETHQPHSVLCLGLGSSSGIRLETTARNLCSFRIPDTAGRQLRSSTIREDGPASYPVTLPLETIKRVLRSVEIESRDSDDAGGYLCNLVLYTLLDDIARENKDIHGGFVHLPRLPEMPRFAGYTPMPFETQCLAITKILEVLRA